MQLFFALALLLAPADVPDAQQIQRATVLVQDVYSNEPTKTPADKLALAKKLIDDALGTRDDPAAQFVLLNLAAKHAGGANDAALVELVCSEIESRFKVTDSRIAPMKELKPSPELYIAAMECVEKAITNDQYFLADEYLQIAEVSARKDAELAKQVRIKKKLISSLADEYAEIPRHLETLAKDPSHPVANHAVGKFLCFRKNDWTNGIQHLAKSEAPLGVVAKADLTGSDNATEQVIIGDKWWDHFDPDIKDQCQLRAVSWYRKALPSLQGLERAKVENRLATVSSKHQHYFAVAKSTDVRCMDWNGRLWAIDCSRRFTFKKENDGYRVIGDVRGGHLIKTILLSGTDAKAKKMVMTITVHDGYADCGIRYKNLKDGGLGIKRIEPNQRTTIEVSVKAAKMNGVAVDFFGELPTEDACYAIVVPRQVNMTIHELYFE